MERTLIKNIFIFLLISFVAISVLAPIASNQYLPSSPDYIAHVASIIQAKIALMEGQFPIRVAPWQHNGWRYPLYQFYAPLPYTVSAIIYNWVTPSNPFIAFKITVFLALILAGIYMYRLGWMVTGSRAAGLLTGILYMTGPYFIINIDIRGAFPEAVAQGIIPIVLYYTLYSYLHDFHLKGLCFASLSWSALAITHTITFVYTSFFVALLIVLLTLQNVKTWKNLIFIGISYCYACILASWFLVPIFFLEKKLFIDTSLISVQHWLTPLSTLFSIRSISPMPLPGNGLLSIPVYPAIGWCSLLGAGICSYIIFFNKPHKNDMHGMQTCLMKSMLILFALAAFATWSPIDFWHYLPKFLTIAQFSYRLLSQVMWTGALLFAFAITWLYKGRMKKLPIAIGIILIGLCNGSWLHTNYSNPQSIKELITKPDLALAGGVGQYDYLVNPQKLPIEIGNLFIKNNILPVEKVQSFCKKRKSNTVCKITLPTEAEWIQLPLLYYPKLLDIKLHGQHLDYYPSQHGNYLLAAIKLVPGINEIQFTVKGIQWAGWTSAGAWIVLSILFAFASKRRHKKYVLINLQSESARLVGTMQENIS